MEKRILLECACGCSVLTLDEETDLGETLLYLSHYGLSYYNNQSPIKDTIKRRLSMIWCAITGKDYRLYDVVLYQKQIEELKNYLNSIDLKKES